MEVEILDNNYQSSLLIPQHHNNDNSSSSCRQLPGTILRIFIPAGAVINLLNLIEVSSPSGICVIVRIPLLGGSESEAQGMSLKNIVTAIENLGGSVEVMGH